ncbi:hypothetical protein PG993_006255 [Apiospora rasikravindrae]|uniref:Protein kinase domain-containing protein n=1 Tax=Apiospora rasikravindrae TaxID=990691 RepID=A0ABR1T565_9PEZI
MFRSKLELRAMSQCSEFRAHITGEEKTGRECRGADAKYVSHTDLRRYWTPDRIEDVLRSSGNPADGEAVRVDYLQVLSILAWTQATLNIPTLHHLRELITHNNNDASLPWPEAPEVSQTKTASTISTTINGDSALSSSTAPRICQGEGFEIHNPGSEHNQQQLRHVVFKTYLDTTIFEEELKAYHALQRKNNNIVRSYGNFYWISDTNVRHSTIILELAEEGSLRDLYKLNDPPTTRDGIRKFWEGFIDLAEGLEALHNYENHEGYSIIHQDLKPSNVLVFRNKNRPDAPFRFKIADFGSSTVKWGSHSQRTSGPDTGSGKTYAPPELHLSHTVDYTVRPSVDTWALGCIVIEASVWLAFGEAGCRRFREERKSETSKDHRDLGCSDTFHDGLEVLQCVRDVPRGLEINGRRCDDLTPRIAQYVLDACLTAEKARHLSFQVVYNLKKILYPKISPGDQHSPSRSTGRNSWLETPPVNGHPEVTMAANEPPRTPPRPSPKPLPYHPNSEADQGIPAISIQTDLVPPCLPTQTSPPKPQPDTIELPNNSNTSTNGQPTNSMPCNPPSGWGRTRSPPLSTNGNNSSPTTPSPPSLNPPRPPSLPRVTADEVLSWIKISKKSKVPNTLSGWDSIKRTLGGRDYIIVVDNSTFMQNHRGEVDKLAKALSYLMKQLDPNGVEVYFTSNPKLKTVCDSSSKVEGLLNKTFSHGHGAYCQMERTLENVFRDVKSKLLNSGEANSSSRQHLRDRLMNGAKASGVSIYVLTSGVWDCSEDGTCGVEKPIENMIAWMREHDVGRTEASIQFVRFGADTRGIKRLTILDDEVPKKEANRDFDIVDHKPSDSSIWEILEGSISKYNDG